jgi:transcriptional regulator with XRE-family HTH domain
MRQIGEHIRELRERRGLTQGDVERCTGMLRAYISRVEHGHTIPSIEIVERFAAFFEVPLYEMFRLQGAKGDKPKAGTNESAFVTLLAGYVRRMAVAERDLLLTLATRLADQREADGTGRDDSQASNSSPDRCDAS